MPTLRITIMTHFNNEQWKQKAASKSLTARDFFFRALHKALDSKSENKTEVFRGLLMKYFTPVTNAKKLANGMTPWKTLELTAAMQLARWNSTTLLQEEKELIQQVFPNAGWGPVADLRDVTYVYFFTRQDISYEQQLVQTAHAAAAVRQEHDFNAHEQHFIVFGVPNEEALLNKYHSLPQEVKISTFFEPDMNGEMTSFATAPIRGSYARRKGWFKSDSLLCLPVNQLVDAE